MNKFKYFFFLTVVIPAFLMAQKKPLSHIDYNQWKKLSNTLVSQNGKYVAYQINPNKGDGNLFVYNVETGHTTTLTRGANAQFSFDENHLIFNVVPPLELSRIAIKKDWSKDEKPKSKLAIMNLTSQKIDTLGYASSFAMPEEYTGILAFEKATYKKQELKKEPKDSTETDSAKTDGKPKSLKSALLIYHFKSKKMDTIKNVDQYVFGKNAADLYYTLSHKKHDSIKGVYHYLNGKNNLLDTSGAAFENLSVSNNGNIATWFSTSDSAKAEIKTYAFVVAQNQKITKKYTAQNTPAIPDGFMANNAFAARFSEDDETVFLEIRPIPLKREKDTNALKTELVKLDVWSWNDTVIQPAQIKNVKREATKGYSMVWQVKSDKWVRLEYPSLQNVRYNLKNVTPLLAGTDSRTTELSSTWDYPAANDLYVVNIETGERKLIEKNVKGNILISPKGNYAYWYDKAQKKHFAQNLKTDQRLVLNQFKEPVYNVDNDVPALPGAYGFAGWSEDDNTAYIYDEFDIWKVDLKNAASPQKLTEGREKSLVYRIYNVDLDKDFIGGEMVVQVFNKESQAEGFVKWNTNTDAFSIMQAEEAFSYRGFEKAKNSEVMIFRKGNFVEYPELYVTNTSFEAPKKISETNPQQEEYNWGTVELVEYTAKKFGKQKALLYKPEDFDPNKKYPVIVYFYEKYSEMLNYHFGFSPSRSTVNFAYFTSNGYIVLVPDIVYQEGEPGKSAYNCVVPAAKWLAKKEYVDANRMAIQGQSWGGYQVAYLVTQTDMFKCAMAGAPVSNMTSAYGGIRWGSGWSRMFQYEKTQSRIGRTLWDDTDLYIKNSPVFYANEVNTPLLMMHNDNDGAVPWYQGIEYIMALRRLQKPAWMLVYNGEEHNLTQWHNRVDLSIRMSQFFDHYLKDAPAPNWMTNGRKAIDKEYNNGTQLLK